MPESTPFPSFEMEGRRFSKMLLGHNPFIGGSYMSLARSRLYKETLAMGRIAPEDGMAYVCRLPDIDGIVVGIGHEYEVEETFGLARHLLPT